MLEVRVIYPLAIWCTKLVAVGAVCAVVGREALCGDVDAPVAVLGEVFAVPDVPDEPLAGEEPSLGLAHGLVVLFEARDEFFPALGVEVEAVADLLDEYLVLFGQ